MIRFFYSIGDSFFRFLRGIGVFYFFFVDIIKQVFKRPFEWKNTIIQMEEIGVKSFLMTSTTNFFTGMVMVLQVGIAIEEKIKGASYFVGAGVSVSMVRELAPVLTSLLIAGRIGSAIAAELGTMKVTEQIDALKMMGEDPIHYLVVPRFVASVIMVPALTILSDLFGVLGGGVFAVLTLDQTISTYLDNAVSFLRIRDILSGLLKSLFFGIEISVISSYQGMYAKGGARGVGKAAINAVVWSSVAILVSDFFLTYLIQFVERFL